jgi:preprotein translocase subunit SecY
MTEASPSTRLGSLARIRGLWRGAIFAAGGLLLCEAAARAPTVRPDGNLMSDYFRRGGAGALLQLYDRLAGGGVSRGTVAALGFMPYLSARIFLRIARAVHPALGETWSEGEGQTKLTRWTRGLTLGLALVQSYGFARFAESIPGAVAQPGVAFIAQTMLVQTAVAMFVMWLGEQVMTPKDLDAPTGHESVTSGSHPSVMAPPAHKTTDRARSR